MSEDANTELPVQEASDQLSELLKSLAETKPEVLALLREHLGVTRITPKPAQPSAKGFPFQLDIASIGPGDTGQLTMQSPQACTLCGIQVEEGLEIVQVFAGPHVLKDNFENVNKPLQPAAWITVLVRNVGKEPQIARGKVFLEGEGLKPEQPSTGFDMAFAGEQAPPPKVFAASPIPTAPAAPQTDVKAGANEVLVLLSYGEAQRLLQVVSGGTPVYDFEKPAFQRRLKNALGMP
jgi:hypothetical protein